MMRKFTDLAKRDEEQADKLQQEIREHYTADSPASDQLIRHTIGVLNSPHHAPERLRKELSIAAWLLARAWLDIEGRWASGDLEDYAAALGRKRPKSWNRHAFKKNHERGPLVFAEINMELSAGSTRTAAVEKMAPKYHASKRQIESWYDEHSARAAESVATGRGYPDDLKYAFMLVASKRGLNWDAGLEEQAAALKRIRKRGKPKAHKKKPKTLRS